MALIRLMPVGASARGLVGLFIRITAGGEFHPAPKILTRHPPRPANIVAPARRRNKPLQGRPCPVITSRAAEGLVISSHCPTKRAARTLNRRNHRLLRLHVETALINMRSFGERAIDRLQTGIQTI